MLRIAYMISKKRFETKMSRGARFHTMHALSRRPDVDLCWVDNGVPRSTPNRFDLTVIYKPEDHQANGRIWGPRCLVFNETHEGTLAEAKLAAADFAICHHENDLPKFDGICQAFHVPHCAERRVFWPDGSHPSARPIDCIVSGVQSPEIYPLRATMAGLVRSGTLPGVVRKHPGYRLKSANACEKQMLDYAAHLRSAKVSLCCTSKHKYALAKIVESMMAGCLVVTDMPDDEYFRRTLGRHCVVVEPGMNAADIADLVRDWLGDAERLAWHAAAGQRLALDCFTMDHWALMFLEKFDAWRTQVEMARI